MSGTTVDVDVLRDQVREKYRAVAEAPEATYHFHTGRPLAIRLGYDPTVLDRLPDRAVESFAGVGNPFSPRDLQAGERVVDIGSGAGFDSFVAAHHVGPEGAVVGVDMTDEMLTNARATAEQLGLAHVEFRPGFAEGLPVPDGWADTAIPSASQARSILARKASGVSGRPIGSVQTRSVSHVSPQPGPAARRSAACSTRQRRSIASRWGCNGRVWRDFAVLASPNTSSIPTRTSAR
jgi:hypothetical protein